MMMTLATLLKLAKAKCVVCSLMLPKMDGCMGAQWVVFFHRRHLFVLQSFFFKRILQAETQCLNIMATNMQCIFLCFLMLCEM